MTLMVAGLVLLVAWPLFSLLLVFLAGHAQVSAERARRKDAASPNGNEPDTFWIIIPCLNEERVVARTVTAALGLAGPVGTKTYVLVVDDASDDRTPEVLAAIRHPNLIVLRRNLPDARRGKGEALNHAYNFICKCSEMYCQDFRRVAVGVIDGDGRGSANLLTEVSRAMRDPRVGATQSRVRIHNRDHLLGAVQDLEFSCIAHASQVLRNGLGTVGLGGNGQFTRLSALAKLGETPWSACLVEDLQLGLRIHLSGERIRYLFRACVTQQGLVDVGRLLRQRTRWAQGNLQCVTFIPRLIASRRIGNTALTEMLYYLLAPWLNALGTIVVLGLLTATSVELLTGHTPALMAESWSELVQVAGVWTAVMVLPHLLWAVVHRCQLRDERLGQLLLAGLAYPGFLMLGLVSTWRALGRQVLGRNSWAKTERLSDGHRPERATPQPDPAETRHADVHSPTGSSPHRRYPARSDQARTGRLRPAPIRAADARARRQRPAPVHGWSGARSVRVES